ncbi:MAG: hypothetical protein AAFS10_19395 [Myxococcota bacterium]
MTPHRILTLMVLCVPLVWSCGDDSSDPNAIVCNSGQPFKQLGQVGDVDGNITAGSGMLDGNLSARQIAFNLGEVEFTPSGSDTSEIRTLVLSFNTNTGDDPVGRDLFTNISLRIEQMGDAGRTFELVSYDPETYFETYCDPANGQLCARFGLDDTGDEELDNIDNVIHLAQSGTITFTEVTATSMAAEWSITFGPNISRAFDTSSGLLEGCFSAIIQSSTGGGRALSAP